jgi:hypothetical protein
MMNSITITKLGFGCYLVEHWDVKKGEQKIIAISSTEFKAGQAVAGAMRKKTQVVKLTAEERLIHVDENKADGNMLAVILGEKV